MLGEIGPKITNLANWLSRVTGDITFSISALTATIGKIRGTTITGTTGSGNVVLDNTPTLITPTLGVATATNLNVTGSALPANGMYLSASNILDFSVNTSKQMEITSAGLVTIGTTSEAASIRVNTNANGGFYIASNNTSGAAITLDSTGGGGGGFQFFATGSANTAGWFGVYNTVNNGTHFGIYRGSSGTAGTLILAQAAAVIGFSNSTATAIGTCDTGISRDSGGVFDFGTGAQGSKAGTINAATANITGTSTLGTLSVTGHSTLEGVTSTGATGTNKIVFDTSPTLVTPLLGTPTSGNLSNCTFPTLNQNTSGSSASLSVSGQTGLMTVTGLASTNRIKTIRDAADTILELGGSYTPTGTWTSLTMVTPVLGTPTSGTLSNCTAATQSARDNSTKLASTAYADAGDSTITQNSQSTAYTTVLTDAGKAIYHPSADTTARTFTIDSNANVAYPVGTTITFVNENAGGVITISITSDTMRLAGAGTTGNRTLAANGIATAYKMTSTSWLISGVGLT